MMLLFACREADPAESTRFPRHPVNRPGPGRRTTYMKAGWLLLI